MRTKKRSFGIVYGNPCAASQRISALVPSTVNHSGGSGLTIGLGVCAQAREPRQPATTGTLAAAACSSRRRVRS